MSDNADRADAPIAQLVSRGLDQVRRTPGLQPDGHCHFCDGPVRDALLFCDVDCRDDFEKEQAAMRRAGR